MGGLEGENWRLVSSGLGNLRDISARSVMLSECGLSYLSGLA